MRFLNFFGSILSIFIICNLAFASTEQPSGLLRLVPRDAMTVIMLKNRPDDAGMNTIKDALKDRFSIEKSEERQQVVEEMTGMFNIREVVGASFYAKGKKPLFILLISGDAGNQELIEAYSSKINILFDNPDEIWYKDHSGIKIIKAPQASPPSRASQPAVLPIVSTTNILL